MAGQFKQKILGAVVVAVAIFAFHSSFAAEVRALASIAPVQSLVAAVMKGIGNPDVLVGESVSPHSYAMKPSDAKKIADADVVFMISPEFETFMAKAAMAKKGDVVYLADVKDMKILPLRSPDNFASYIKNTRDLHLWTDTDNAIKMVQKIALVLAEKDWKNASMYIKNAGETINKIKKLEAEKERILGKAQQFPYLVYHDAWQYFEKQNGLNAVAAVVADEDVPMSVRHKLYLQNAVIEKGVKCLFVEPWFNDEKVAKLADDLGVIIKEADPIGIGLGGGANQYFNMMKNAALAYRDCLEN